jgi:putative membrane protein
MTEYPLLNAAIFAALGVTLFAIGFSIVSKLLPFDLKKDIAEGRNTAAAIVIAAITLGMAWIIATTMH